MKKSDRLFKELWTKCFMANIMQEDVKMDETISNRMRGILVRNMFQRFNNMCDLKTKGYISDESFKDEKNTFYKMHEFLTGLKAV